MAIVARPRPPETPDLPWPPGSPVPPWRPPGHSYLLLVECLKRTIEIKCYFLFLHLALAVHIVSDHNMISFIQYLCLFRSTFDHTIYPHLIKVMLRIYTNNLIIDYFEAKSIQMIRLWVQRMVLTAHYAAVIPDSYCKLIIGLPESDAHTQITRERAFRL